MLLLPAWVWMSIRLPVFSTSSSEKIGRVKVPPRPVWVPPPRCHRTISPPPAVSVMVTFGVNHVANFDKNVDATTGPEPVSASKITYKSDAIWGGLSVKIWRTLGSTVAPSSCLAHVCKLRGSTGRVSPLFYVGGAAAD